MTDAKLGMVALIPGLGDSKANFSTSGSVGIYDKTNKLVSEIEVAQHLWQDGHQHRNFTSNPEVSYS